jgi:hypothetical protein
VPTRQERWDAGVAHLRAYVSEHGHADVPLFHVCQDGFRLGSWVKTVRRTHREGELTAQRREQLQALGFRWRLRDYDQQWTDGLTAFERFVSEHGHARVPANFVDAAGYPLGRWVMTLRTQARRDLLPGDRRTTLDRAGFLWSVSDRDETWRRGLAALTTYVQTYGNARVPSKYVDPDGHRLGLWVRTRRTDKRDGRLTAEREAALNELGFEWVLRVVSDTTLRVARGDMRFRQWLQRLDDYRAQHGHANVPSTVIAPDGAHLGAWLNAQRHQYRAGRLRPDRERELRERGVDLVVETTPPRGRATSTRSPSTARRAGPPSCPMTTSPTTASSLASGSQACGPCAAATSSRPRRSMSSTRSTSPGTRVVHGRAEPRLWC